jgi:hypothetical protein
MYRNNTADSFPERMRAAHHKLLDVMMGRFTALRDMDWSMLAGSQKLFTYARYQAIDGIPVDWFIRGCDDFRCAPIEYRDNQLDVLTKNDLVPITDVIEKRIGERFHLKIACSGVENLYTTIYLMNDDLKGSRMGISLNAIDSNLANWVSRKREIPPTKLIPPRNKRICLSDVSELRKLMEESADILAKLTAVNEEIAALNN